MPWQAFLGCSYCPNQPRKEKISRLLPPLASRLASAGWSDGSRRCSAEAECWTECSGSQQLRPDGGDCGRTLWGRLRRRCCTQTGETAPKKAAPTHRPGKGWGAVAAPFNSLLHTPTTPETQPPNTPGVTQLCQRCPGFCAIAAVLGLNARRPLTVTRHSPPAHCCPSSAGWEDDPVMVL